MISIGASLVLGGFNGKQVSPEIKELLEDGLAGVILFSRNMEGPAQIAELLSRICEASPGHNPLRAVDQEGGKVARLEPPATVWPAMRKLGSLNDPNLARKTAVAMARELLVLGFNWDLAPVLDVDSNPDNPIIKDRSFSDDPKTVARIGTAFFKGLEEQGIGPCGKHFPGHGHTGLDSHKALPKVESPVEVLEARELVPFREAIENDIPALMTAHVVFEGLDPSVPATLSLKIMRDLLRDRLGFKGMLVSDALNMAAVSDFHEVEDLVIQGLEAGVDLFIACWDVQEAYRAQSALRKEAEKSAAFKKMLNKAKERVEGFKQRFRLENFVPNQAEIEAVLGCDEHKKLAEKISTEKP
ncbi:MAG: beta-N-acetylhexosaminidase [Deltaproteobacteria bacterium]|nr:beta-N-acetylhexosaminidase [Deltaproteobacteria bacterium]